MVVKSTETRVRKIAGVFIFPTLNNFTTEQGARLQSHPDFQQAVKLGTMEILKADSVDEEELDTNLESTKDDGSEKDNVVELVKAANVEDAVELIQEILDPDQLEEIIGEDRRKTVKKAAKAQLEEISEDEDEDEE